MINIIPDLFRCLVTDVMLAVLMYIMSKPKYRNKVLYITVTTIIVISNIFADSIFYLQNDNNKVAIVDVIMLIVIAVLLKPLFLDSVMQWCFSYLTVLNIYATVVIVSYWICDLFPYPYWSNSLLRIVLFTDIAVLFWRYIRPFYYKIVEYWHIYSLISIALFINIFYYFVKQDIEQSFIENFIPILLLIVMEVFLYIGIFVSFKLITAEYALREEKIKTEAQHKLLESELATYEEFLQSARQSRHDLRHHNSLVLEYLNTGNVKEAEEYLKSQLEDLSQASLEVYCENQTANAVYRLYARKARVANISYGVVADIPKKLPLSDVEIGSLLSNMLENAIQACEDRKNGEVFIRFLVEHDSYTMKLELKNSVFVKTKFDEKAMPVSQKEHGGTGTLSISSIVKHHGGMLSFSQEQNVFITRIVFPLYK